MIMSVASVLSHPVFRAAALDLASLGLTVSAVPAKGAVACAVVGGRSNARWWLLPLVSRQVTRSGWAMFQPVTPVAKLFKAGAVMLSGIGLSSVWAGPPIYLHGRMPLAGCFDHPDAVVACFTGTDSPHRKIALQVMDTEGGLLGYVKAGRHPSVAVLLSHEAAVLQQVAQVGLRSAHVPRVLFSGPVGDGFALATDTTKTRTSVSPAQLLPSHQEFLREMASLHVESWSGSARSEVAKGLLALFARLRSSMPPGWVGQLEALLDGIAAADPALHPAALTHGDFTPWNTYLTAGRLGVFDWEYAGRSLPASTDLIHFLLACPSFRKATLDQQWDHLRKAMQAIYGIDDLAVVQVRVAIHFTQLALRTVERAAASGETEVQWDGLDEMGRMATSLLRDGRWPQ